MKKQKTVDADFEILWNRVVSSDDFHPTCDNLRIRPSLMVRQLEMLAENFSEDVVQSITDLAQVDMAEALRTCWELNNG